jgi:hypothetical protein
MTTAAKDKELSIVAGHVRRPVQLAFDGALSYSTAGGNDKRVLVQQWKKRRVLRQKGDAKNHTIRALSAGGLYFIESGAESHRLQQGRSGTIMDGYHQHV